MLASIEGCLLTSSFRVALPRLFSWWCYVRCRRNQMMFTIVVAAAITTISHTHQAIPYSSDAGVSVCAGVGVAVAIGADAGGDSEAVYSTEPMSWF